VLLPAVLFAVLPGTSEAIERRKPQFLKEPAYLFVPFPYDLPGIGSGVAFTVLAANIAGTNTDAFGILVTGDAEGSFVAVEDFHLIEERLQLRLENRNITKALINNYQSRGMDSDPDDFTLLEIGQADGQEIALCLCLFDRRLQFSIGIEVEESRIDRIRDSSGEIIGDFSEPVTSDSITRFFGFMIDYTDDRQDPRRGVRLEMQQFSTPPEDADDPDFFVVDASLSFYVPIGQISTLVINYFQSDANVQRKGETDPEVLRQELGLGCLPGDQECLDAEQQFIDRRIAENTFGSATPLGGGFGRLRAYPTGRFRGAHTIFYGLEFRWNLTEEVTPFDYFIWKDVRTSVQLAFFAETGSVEDLRSELGDTFRSSYGMGLRLISGSGFVYRLDIATGDEETETIVIFGYPF
jgi:hypothetical protein